MSNEETPPVSGSRWEPATPPAAPGTPPAPSTDQPIGRPVDQPTAPAPAAYSPAPARRHRGSLILAGGALGIALVAGGGGFALGHATGDDGPGDGFGRIGLTGDGTGQPPGFNGQQPPGFQGGPGVQDDDGVFPGPDGDGDHQGWDDGSGGTGDDGAAEGSSTT